MQDTINAFSKCESQEPDAKEDAPISCVVKPSPENRLRPFIPFTEHLGKPGETSDHLKESEIRTIPPAAETVAHNFSANLAAKWNKSSLIACTTLSKSSTDLSGSGCSGLRSYISCPLELSVHSLCHGVIQLHLSHTCSISQLLEVYKYRH